ncbi:histidine phosphatase family protein [Actinorhabdospora filicis]|nr:histidine phosphatase family protein [Actinorhabdospora filicis]
MTIVHIVQHGSKLPVPGDPGLTDAGFAQAEAVARHFSTAPGVTLWSSPLLRARQTIAPLATKLGLDVRLDERLRERANWDGTRPIGDFLADWARCTADRDHVPAEGESSRAAGERFLGFLREAEGTVIAAAHGGVTVDLLRTLVGDEGVPALLLEEGMPPGAVTTIEDLRPVRIAYTGHLSAGGE